MIQLTGGFKTSALPDVTENYIGCVMQLDGKKGRTLITSIGTSNCGSYAKEYFESKARSRQHRSLCCRLNSYHTKYKSTFYIIIYALHLRKSWLYKENKKWVLSSWVSSSFAHSHLDMEWRARDVVITPLNVEDVLAPVRQLVGNPVLALALVFHVDLVARGLGTVDSDKENVVASTVAVHNEGVLFSDHWSREARTGTSDRRGVGDEVRLDRDRPAVRARVGHHGGLVDRGLVEDRRFLPHHRVLHCLHHHCRRLSSLHCLFCWLFV